MNSNSQTLLELQFQEIGEWKFSDNMLQIQYSVKGEGILDSPNVLYSFVIKSNVVDTVGYIGKTTKSIKNRFQGYLNPGVGQKTNLRVSEKIREVLKSGEKVFIYVLLDIEPLQWAGISINLPAGIEDGLVYKLKPLWNIAGVQTSRIKTSSEDFEDNSFDDTLVGSELDDSLTSFKIYLGKAYYNQGFMNPGIKASDYLGLHNEEVILMLPNKKIIKSKIDRTSNPNHSVRVYFGNDLSDWYHKNHKLGDTLIALIKSGNRIILE